jgi:subtilisin family serine protease
LSSACTSGTAQGCGRDTGGDPVIVALLDSGIALEVSPDARIHPDSRSLVTGEQIGDDGTGHGTAMARIVHDAAPGAELLIVKVLDRAGGGSPAVLAKGIRHATEAGAQIVNVSSEFAGDDPSVRAALDLAQDRGVLVVVAAGNEGLDLDRFTSYPASYDHANVIVVAAVGPEGHLTGGSNWGAETVDLGAPGEQGSSVAAGAVSAAAARLLIRAPMLAASDLKRALLDSVDRRPAMRGRTATEGVLDANAAAELATC